MREIYETYLADIPKDNTRKGQRTALRRFDEFIDGKDLEEVDKYDLKDWVNDMKGEVSDLTLKNYFYGISSFYSWLQDWGERYDLEIDESSNPFESVELPDFGVDPNSDTRVKKAGKREESYRALEVSQVKDLIDNVPSPTVRNQLIIRLLYQTGVRSGELISIELSDLDRENRQIRIYSQKTDSYRTVFYRESLDTLLDIFIDGGYRDRSMYSEASPYLFPTRQSEQISKNTVGSVVKEAAENAGLQGEAFQFKPAGHDTDCSYAEITPHVLRHTMAHHSLHEGDQQVDLVTLSKVLGHESLETTKKYLDAGLNRDEKL